MRYVVAITSRHVTQWLVCLLAIASGPVLRAESATMGVQIYRSKCAVCHGAAGQGTRKHPERLAGDLTVAKLAKLIRETMPEDDPGSLSDGESRTVAEFIHGSFYSPLAQARNQPPRVALARLTVGQYRQSAADLIAAFRKPASLGEERGVRGEYYAGRRIGGRRGGVASRIDPQVDFDFGTSAPLSEIKEPHSFSIRWSGGVLAPETGHYEFVVHTQHAARLWINDLSQPLVDAWVKSGDETRFRARRFLVGGRVYPLRLEFSKAKQGVDDSKKQKKPPASKPASISLLWRQPRRPLEEIPSRQLVPQTPAEVFACATAFPPDDRSYGWERGTSVSKAWNDAATEAAIETATYVADRINELSGVRTGDAGRAAKLRTFCHAFARRAFRRPLDDQLSALVVDRQFQAAKDVDTAVKRVVLLVLTSPRFLFREAGGPDQFDVASRLSFGLWDSIPDEDLLDAARDGRLKTREQVAQQAERMLRDPRAQAKLRGFLLSWLNVESVDEIRKDAELFSQFDEQAIADLRTSLELLLDEVVWSESSDFRRFFLAEEVYLNSRLARAYGVDVKGKGGFSPCRLDQGNRAGVLTHPYLMAQYAHSRETSPIHRGVFLARGLLGRTLRPPPQAVTPVAADLHPELTTRERVTLQTKAASCMTCHAIINPLGFALEHYDAVGRYRQLDSGKPIDDRGSYTTLAENTVQFQGARPLAEFLATSRQTQRAFAERLFQYLVQQSVNAYGAKTLEELTDQFAAQEFHIRRLAVEVMVFSALVGHNSKWNSN